ncbi:MAG TPA: putative glycoside hydrolase [Bryobacteraceae bacterium]|nr:putative glycoside hydrolase [Bryobacteraceae bacterium]
MPGSSMHAARVFGVFAATCLATAQTPNPGHVTYVADSGKSSIQSYVASPPLSLQQWFQNHIAGMIAYPPAFNADLSWFPNAYAYFDLYGIQKGSWEEAVHPEWILHDQNGNRLYMPFNCSGGTCAQYAADIANPAFRAAWITNAAGTVFGFNYPGVFIDDVNMNFQVSDGSGNLVAPIDSNTGQPMTYDAWRNYVATFLEEARAAMPGIKIMENTVWYAGPTGVQDADAAIQRQIKTADIICLERGVASDTGLSGGTGSLSVYSFLNYIDRVHAAGKPIHFYEYSLDNAGKEYGLASYFLISNGSDSIGDSVSTPDNWWGGYDIDLGTPLGPRTYQNGIFERDFTGGKVLLGEPGLASQTVDLGGTYTRLDDGTSVTSVTIGSAQGVVLTGTTQQSAVRNAASQTLTPASPGEIITLPALNSDPSVRVLINGVAAPVIFSGSGQVSVIVPFELDLSQPAQIEVQQGEATAMHSVPVAAASPAIFTMNASGSGQGAILNQDFSVNSAANPATAGSVIMVYATGFGALSPSPPDGQIAQALASTTSAVTATVGGVPAEVLYAGAAPDLVAGVEQVNIQVPPGVTPNAAAPISLAMGSYTSPPGVTVSIQ